MKGNELTGAVEHLDHMCSPTPTSLVAEMPFVEPSRRLGYTRGFPRVLTTNLYPYPQKPAPVGTGAGFLYSRVGVFPWV